MRSSVGSLYLNIEDTRLYGLSPEDFPALLDVIGDLAGNQAVFLDEIQELVEWPRQLVAYLTVRIADISIVAAAFSVDADAAAIVRRARMAYGGVAATPCGRGGPRPRSRGERSPMRPRDVAAVLAGEFKPIDDVRGSAEYRRGLIVSLWEKFAVRRGEQRPGRPAWL